jgi:TRAP-type C4-dicarboxylate transport system permease small subunit
MQSWINRLHRAEDALLVVLLSTMIVLAGTQIILRNFLDSGFVWIDPLLRVLVLWLGLLGATVATRNNKHIRIDLLSKLFDRNTHRLIQSLVGQVSAWTCIVIAWAWMLEVIVPVAFGLIGLRYFIKSVGWARLYVLHLKLARRQAQ